MGTGQMLITVGAMILLSIIILSVNQGYILNNEVMLDSKFDLLAISLAISIVEDANGLAFDQRTTGGNTVMTTSQLSSIGHGSSEYYIDREHTNFNDFDDYDGLHIVYNDTTLRSAIYNIDCQVGYISDANPNVFTSSKTWFKKLDVMISSPSMTDTIRMSTVMSYFYFR